MCPTCAYVKLISAMKMSKSVIKICASIITVVLLVVFYRSNRDPISPMQLEYNNWVSKLIESSLNSSLTSDLPKVSLQIPLMGTRTDKNLELPESKDKVFRLLELAKEARLFDLRHKSARSAKNTISFTVERNGQVFRSDFPISAGEESAQVALFLKLFQLYGVEHPTLAMNKEGSSGAVKK